MTAVTPTTPSAPVREQLRRSFRPTLLNRPAPVAAPATGPVAPPRPAGALIALGVRIDRVDVDTALARIDEMLRRPSCSHVAFVNAHSMNLTCDHPEYREALARADLVLNDGAGVALLGRALGTPFLDNLNGTDFVPRILARLGRGHSVFLYGGRPGVAERAAERLRREYPGLRIAGCLDGYRWQGGAAADGIRRSGADVVLVALGNPRQELWVEQWGDRTGATLAVSVGAFLDFAAGQATRAPVAVRALRLEWAFRLAHEPRRLALRYLVGIPVFVTRVAQARLGWDVPVGRPETVETYEYPPLAGGGMW